MRNHVVQYAAEPGFEWYRLRREWPWVYESHADLELERWTKVKIEVAGRGAKLYLNESTKPTLIVDGLKGEDLRGVVALWNYTNEEAYFSNVRITSAVAQPVRNGSDVAGTWAVRYLSDAGVLDGSMILSREGNKVKGTWSGDLGQGCIVTGTWRDGYVELSFPGEWPKESQLGAPGPVTAFLAGWIDGDSGKGRLRVEGRSDGRWWRSGKTGAGASDGWPPRQTMPDCITCPVHLGSGNRVLPSTFSYRNSQTASFAFRAGFGKYK